MDSAKAYHPGETLKIRLQTDSPALVALGAVDTALYAVGSKSHKPLNMAKVCQAPFPNPAPPQLIVLLPWAPNLTRGHPPPSPPLSLGPPGL